MINTSLFALFISGSFCHVIPELLACVVIRTPVGLLTGLEVEFGIRPGALTQVLVGLPAV